MPPAPLATPPSPPEGETVARATVFVRGRVQGVGFRWWIRARALELDLAGHARNTDDGRVEVVAEGPRPAVEQLLALLEPGTPPASGTAGGHHRPGHVAARSAPLWTRPREVVGFLER